MVRCHGRLAWKPQMDPESWLTFNNDVFKAQKISFWHAGSWSGEQKSSMDEQETPEWTQMRKGSSQSLEARMGYLGGSQKLCMLCWVGESQSWAGSGTHRKHQRQEALYKFTGSRRKAEGAICPGFSWAGTFWWWALRKLRYQVDFWESFASKSHRPLDLPTFRLSGSQTERRVKALITRLDPYKPMTPDVLQLYCKTNVVGWCLCRANFYHLQEIMARRQVPNALEKAKVEPVFKKYKKAGEIAVQAVSPHFLEFRSEFRKVSTELKWVIWIISLTLKAF